MLLAWVALCFPTVPPMVCDTWCLYHSFNFEPFVIILIYFIFILNVKPILSYPSQFISVPLINILFSFSFND